VSYISSGFLMMHVSLGARLQQTYASEAIIISIAPSPPRGDKDNWPETLVKRSSMEIESAVSFFMVVGMLLYSFVV
jgi:hypothetical protein